jgi:PAS domain S-box-containing protein
MHADSEGTLFGRVVDPSGRAVPNANVVLRNSATLVERTVTTSNEGLYEVPALPVGSYRLQVRAAGFRLYTVEAITMEVARIIDLDLHLEIGDLSEEVTVQSQAALVDAGTTSVGHVIDGRTVQDIPLNGRYFLDLAVLSPGSVTSTQNGVAAALEESEVRFRNMADTAPVLMWVSGPDKLCTFFNKAWLVFTGRDMKQELGNSWVELIHPDDRDLWHKTYSLSFDSRSAFQMEYRLRRADGEYRSLLCAGAPRFQNYGAFAGYIGSSLDITELKRAQEKALAGQKLESMGLLASGIAHDFNNLLGGILASAELALEERAESASCEEELQRIKAAADGGAQIVRELMIFGATENPSFEPIDFSLVVREMIQVLKISISKTVTLNSDLPVDLGMVLGSAAQLRQLVMNLVINASQAIGDREGKIRITMKVLPEDASAMIAAEGNLSACKYLRLEVADTGDGMTEQVKARIFDPYFSTKRAGRGLGLAVVQRIVGAHAGVIKVLSAPGSGTTFQVMLPCIPKVEIAKEDPSAGSRGVAEESFTVTVLVIEDETALRTSVSRFLRRRGFSVIEAEDGNAGVALFVRNAERIDVVLLDMTLPGRSGRDVLYELRRIAAGVKVVVTSAYGQQHVQSLLGELRTWGYVQKPYRLADLEEILQKCAAKTRKAGLTAD